MLRRVVEPIGEAVQLGGPEQAIRSLLATVRLNAAPDLRCILIVPLFSWSPARVEL